MNWDKVKAWLLGTPAQPSEEEGKSGEPTNAEPDGWPKETLAPDWEEPEPEAEPDEEPELLLALIAGRVRVGHVETRQVKKGEALFFVEQDGPPWPITEADLETAHPYHSTTR